jgi:predicted phosphatase
MKTKNPMKPTIAIDFDGVIHAYKNGWQGNANLEPPVPGAVDALNALGKVYKVVVYSTRAQTTEGREAIAGYLKKIGVKETLEITDKKPIAVCYVDDRAIRFRGDWLKTINEIRDFRLSEMVDKLNRMTKP